MEVTDKKLVLENRLIKKLDLMIERLKGTDDNVVDIDGDEGQGKSNLAAGICYYVAFKTGRHYGIDRIFFDLDELIKFASETKEQIIHWDEGALGGLSTQWWKKNQQKFIQFLMIARKKKHFIVICIPKFYRLNEYINVERTIALIHVYARQNIHKGRFFYYNKDKKELLQDDWRRSHKKSYVKYRSFGGVFKEYMKDIFSDEELQQYEDKKDKAILSLSTPENTERLSRTEVKLKKVLMAFATYPFGTMEDKAKHLEVSTRTIARYKEIEDEPLQNAIPLLTI